MLSNRSRLAVGNLLIILSLFIGSATAHDLHISKVNIVSGDSKMHLELTINAHELKFMEEVDQNNDGKIDRAEFEKKKQAIGKRLLGSLQLKINGIQVEATTSGVMMDIGSHHLFFRAHYPENDKIESLTLTSDLQEVTSESHVTRVTYTNAGNEKLAKLRARSNSVTFGSELNSSFLGTSVSEYSGFVSIFIGLIIASGLFYGFRRTNFSN